MTYVQALVLGSVQGLTEFLPISSSGHLVLFSKLPWWNEQPLVFDTTLHLATALTLIVYFFKDLNVIVGDFFNELKNIGISFLQLPQPTSRNLPLGSRVKDWVAKLQLWMCILIGSLPTGLFGYLFGDDFENKFRSVESVSMFMFLGTLLMFFAQKNPKPTAVSMTVSKSLLIGIFQSLALFPGVSRSGATISGSLLVGLTKVEAARFSFLLSIPIVVLAGAYKAVTTDWSIIDVNFYVLTLGFIASFLTGLLVVHFFLNYLKTKNLDVFIWYRFLLVLVMLFLR